MATSKEIYDLSAYSICDSIDEMLASQELDMIVHRK